MPRSAISRHAMCQPPRERLSTAMKDLPFRSPGAFKSERSLLQNTVPANTFSAEPSDWRLFKVAMRLGTKQNFQLDVIGRIGQDELNLPAFDGRMNLIEIKGMDNKLACRDGRCKVSGCRSPFLEALCLSTLGQNTNADCRRLLCFQNRKRMHRMVLKWLATLGRKGKRAQHPQGNHQQSSEDSFESDIDTHRCTISRDSSQRYQHIIEENILFRQK